MSIKKERINLVDEYEEESINLEDEYKEGKNKPRRWV